MRKSTISLLSTLLLFSSVSLRAADIIPITPKPVSTTQGAGDYTFCDNTIISYPKYANDSIGMVVRNFTKDFKTTTGIALSPGENTANAPILLKQDKTLAAEEYTLQVTPLNITITAARPVGFFYAFQSLKQLMPPAIMAVKHDPSVTKWSVPAISIKDKPRFGWRGFMLDVGRHFFDKNEIKRVIDVMAMYKMNRFHWHLSEDQGWRIEIKKYPKLTEIGSKRKYSQVWGPDHKPYHDYVPYGPYYYTQEDIKEVVHYAKERFIEILPEIDMPGHFQAALAAYPEFSCTPNKKHEVWTDYGISTDVLNVANPKSVQFAKDILDEVTALFPFGYIHIGGDECPTNEWKTNTQCQELLKKIGSANYHDLQTHFFKDIEKYLANKKKAVDRRRIIAWNETLSGNLEGSNVTIMAWVNATAAAKKAADMKLDVIMSPYIPYYINRKQTKDPNEPFSQGNGTETVQSVYNYEPVGKDVTEAQRSYYKGVQANFWTEHVGENWKLEYLMTPRIAAVAEAGWTPSELKNFEDFIERFRHDTKLFDMINWKYSTHTLK